ncbi:MAG: acetyl-CoA hydrolase/transferase family protein [Dehalococcoidia bacterium]
MQIVSAEEAIAALPRSGRVFVGPGCGLPVVLGDAIGATADRFRGLQVYVGLVFEPIGLLDADPACVRLVSLHPTGPTEPLITRGDADYLPLRYSQIPSTFSPGGALPVDAAVIQVAPPDARGFCSLGVSVGTAAPVSHAAPLVIAEINPRMPRTHGSGALHVSEIDLGVEVDHPLVPLSAARVTETEQAIARHVAALVPDGATIQIGIGAVPQAILEALSGHRDLGVHSGMLCDGMIPLIESGAINGARKSLDPYRHAAGEVLGTERLFEFVDDNPGVLMLPATRSHGLEYVRGQRGFVSINSALEVDLTGQVNAEWLGGRQVSGLGGSFDFVEGALYAPDGFSVLAMTATAARGTASRIVPHFAAGTAVTTPRQCVDYVVTEFGVADLRAKTLRERGDALAAIAHPQYRAALVASLTPPA